MKKQLICFVLAVLLAVPCSVSADRHIVAEASLNGSSGPAFSAEVYETGEKTIVLSSLFPDEALVVSRAGDVFSAEDLDYFRPDRAGKTVKELFSDLISWSSEQNGKKRNGIFTGDLFDYATTVQETEIGIGETMSFLRKLRSGDGTNSKSGLTAAGFLNRIDLSKVPDFLTETGLHGKIRSYDSGRYAVLEISDSMGIVMTISADLSVETGSRFLVSHTENGRYYYQLIRLESLEKETVWTVELYSGTGSSFRSATNSDPLLTERLSWVAAEENTCSFDYILSSRKLGDSLVLSGTGVFDSDGCFSADAVLYVQGREEKMTITLKTDHGTAYEAEAGVKETDLLRDDLNTLRLTVTANLANGLAGIIPVLPESYRKLIMTLFFN